MNMREDTLDQILSYSNVSAGCEVLVMETMHVWELSLGQSLNEWMTMAKYSRPIVVANNHPSWK